MSDAEIDAMSPEDRKSEANQILREKENAKLGDSKLFTQDELNNMSQADREIHLDRIDGVDSFENMSADTVTKLALGLVGSMAGLAGIAFAWGSTTTPAPERSQIAEHLAGRRREDEYDPQTGQMLVTDENGNMKLFYKDEDGNLRVKEKDQDGNILDRMPNPKEFINEVRSYQGYSQGVTIINVNDTKTERQSSINIDSTPTRILDKNPQSSLIISSYNEKIVKSLQDIEKNRSILIQKETSRESILSSDEGFLLKQNESNARYAFESIKRSLNDVNIKHSEAIAQYNKYAADYGILIAKGQLDPMAFDGLMKNHYEGILKPAEDELNLANKSKLPLINKYKSEVKIATEKTNKYVEIQSKKIKEGITNSKILEATKLLSKLNSADIDPKLKAAYEKLELAEKNLNNTKAEPGTKEYKKIMDAYLNEKKKFLNSDVGRDIAKQINLAGRPNIYLDNYKPLKSEYTIKETVFSISNEQQSRIMELRNTLEGREILNQESLSKIKELQQEFEDSKILLDKKRESVSNEVKVLQAKATLKREELAAGNDSQEIKNKKLTEIEKN
ncbi:MAG: hypothetical protein GW938_00150 [Leptospira sp.]|nr:hypothetical protein [Leptospira sp.]NCS95047.1 hypothetical protein [Leptospira sp.]